MYYDIIKLFNLKQFNIKIKTAEITKIDNVLYYYMTLERNTFSCHYCGGTEISIKDYRKKKLNTLFLLIIPAILFIMLDAINAITVILHFTKLTLFLIINKKHILIQFILLCVNC